MIVVVGQVLVQLDRLEEALALSLDHVRRSRAESGCISHAVHHDVENPLCLVFVERWADQAALAQHFAEPASGAFVRAMAALAAEAPSIAIYRASALPAPDLGRSAGPASEGDE